METFQSVQDEIDWARTTLQRAHNVLISYVQDEPFALVPEDDPETGGQIHKVKRVKDPPVEFGHLVRNALLDLRHSFDRAQFVAAQVSGYGQFDKNYPWSQDIDDLRRILRQRQRFKKTALPVHLLREIYRQKPYPGPPVPPTSRHLVREVAKMANDKHSVGFTFSASPASTMISGADLIDATLVFSGWDTVNNEMTLARIAPGGQAVYGQTALSVEVFFEGRPAMDGVPVPAAMGEFLKAAQACLEGFKRACGQ